MNSMLKTSLKSDSPWASIIALLRRSQHIFFSRSSKAIDKPVITNFRDKIVAIACFRDKNDIFYLYDKMSWYIMICHDSFDKNVMICHNLSWKPYTLATSSQALDLPQYLVSFLRTGHLKIFGGPTQFLYSKFHGLLKLIFHTNQYNGA